MATFRIAVFGGDGIGPEVVAEAYDDAAAVVAGVTDLPRTALPETCPYTIEQVLTEGFLR